MTDIPLSAHVKCTDGACGKATHVVLNPVTRQVTHFALEDKKLPNNPTRLVPVSKVTGTTSSEIRLNCSINDVARMPAFIVENFIETPVTGDAWDMGSAYLHPHTFNEKPLDTYEEENIPAQEIAVASGMEIEAIDGKLGKLDNLVLDPNTGAISHLLMREGHLWGKKLVTIPISAVESTKGDVIYLKLDQKAVAELPTVPLKK
jgi:sporulation protein YlmC with PRC-barrel domain